MIRFSVNKKTLLSCDKDTKGKVVVPGGVETIGDSAFKDCREISEIVLPDTISKIGLSAFENCTSLETIRIPEKVQHIPHSCFRGCTNLRDVYFLTQGNCLYVEDWAFEGCRSLTDINLPVVLTGSYPTFKGCSNLRQIILKGDLRREIGSEIFSGCKSLTEIRIPKDIYLIKGGAFSGCTGLERVIIESEHIEIEPTAFLGCTHITKLYFNCDPVRVLSAFPDSTKIESISLAENFSGELTEKSISLRSIQNYMSNELKFMASFYGLFDMNITQMKWSECPKRNHKSFKTPVDTEWEKYQNEPQSTEYLSSLKWEKSSGIGLVLGYNQYRALDVDRVRSDEIDTLIDEMLKSLKLPSDYPWVVRSGSGYGFHIIFKCDDNSATQNLNSISFEFNDKYSGWMELRWRDHLVLPPSLHASGLQYKFRNGSRPSSQPGKVEFTVLGAMIDEYCGKRVFREAYYKGIKIELTEIKKIQSRYQSGQLNIQYHRSMIEWLKYTSNSSSCEWDASVAEAKNSLALCYLFGDGVERNRVMAVNHLRYKNCSQSATFNILQLYACGAAKLDVRYYNEALNQLDTKLFAGHLTILQENAKKYLPGTELYLFFDTETTGLPKDDNAPSSDTSNWPRIVQLSWIVTDKFQNIISEHNCIIQPDGWIIPSDSTSIHGISNEFAKSHGEPLEWVLCWFEEDFRLVKYVIGHNIDFDRKVVDAEFHRIDWSLPWDMANRKALPWDKATSICTMKSSVDFCKIPSRYGSYRYPKLQELHFKLFGSNFENAHDASSDVSATVKCFWELVKRGVIIIPQ